MEISWVDSGNLKVANIESIEYKIRNAQDALELLMNCHYQGSNRIIIQEENLEPEFFDLKTKIAGEILQKFSMYDGYLAIVGDFSKYQSKSLHDFIYESNKLRRINFVADHDAAVQALGKI